eukprot:154795_1
MSLTLVNTIDKALAIYYQQFNKNYFVNNETQKGKFKAFIEEQDFDEEDIKDQLKGDATSCALLDFDDNFPFSTEIDGKDVKMQQMFDILKYISIHGTCPIQLQQDDEQDEKYAKFDLETINVNLSDEQIDKLLIPYETQMGLSREGNDDLRFSLALSQTLNFPFLTYLVDTYSRDNAKHFKIKQQKMTISEWAEQNLFMKALKKKYPASETKLQSAMMTYGKRIMKRVSLTPAIKIQDNLEEICGYVSSIPEFIEKIIKYVNPPFQIDLNIVVNGITPVGSSDAKENDDDENDDDDDDDDDIKTDSVPINVAQSLHQYPVVYVERNDEDEKLFARILNQHLVKLRDELSKFNSEHKEMNEKIKYNPETFPQHRRFAICIDRRESAKNDDGFDKTIMYLYPNSCNSIPKNHVPEIGFKLLETCIIPRGTVTKPANIGSKTDVGGKLITFMFNIEKKDEIKCYVVWDDQMMRFHAEQMMEVLPCLFVNDAKNVDFIQGQEIQKYMKGYDTKMKDVKYRKFDYSLKSYKSDD